MGACEVEELERVLRVNEILDQRSKAYELIRLAVVRAYKALAFGNWLESSQVAISWFCQLRFCSVEMECIITM